VIAGVGNYVIENPSDLGNFMIADTKRLVGVLHGCLKTHTPYNEAVAWAHHNTGVCLTSKNLGCLAPCAGRDMTSIRVLAGLSRLSAADRQVTRREPRATRSSGVTPDGASSGNVQKNPERRGTTKLPPAIDSTDKPPPTMPGS
jgi:hypothetical protein